MEKIKVVIFGVGKCFWENKEYLEKTYQIVGWSDNACREIKDLDYDYIEPARISDSPCNQVIVTTEKYFEQIRLQLIESGVLYDHIIKLRRSDNDMKYRRVIKDMQSYQTDSANTENAFAVTDDLKFMISDLSEEAGSVPAHYFMQDLYVAKKIFRKNPSQHYDIGSRLDGFIAHLLVFREVNYLDIRPLSEEIEGLHFTQADATNLSGIMDGTIESISCLHALEHFGLGRYGDPIDAKGYEKVAKSMQRVLKKDGMLYLSVPIGNQNKLFFNAHRIFCPAEIIGLFDKMQLEEFAVINPFGCGMRIVDPDAADRENYQEYSCGIFTFRKL